MTGIMRLTAAIMALLSMMKLLSFKQKIVRGGERLQLLARSNRIIKLELSCHKDQAEYKYQLIGFFPKNNNYLHYLT